MSVHAIGESKQRGFTGGVLRVSTHHLQQVVDAA